MAIATAPDAVIEVSSEQLRKLRRLNIIAGFAHLVQMIAVLLLTNDFVLPVTATYMQGPPGSPLGDPTVLFDSRVGWGVALFFGLSALFHFLVASPLFFSRYANGLAHQRNYFRWVEYSISSSVMIAGIVPWLAILIYVISPGAPGELSPPAFVYGIIISLFIFFNIFALVQWLQYKKVGRWANYLAGERSYIILSLVAKSLLAWQIFGGTLAP